VSLPDITCPACGVAMPMEVALGHQGARDALLALATLHPSATRLPMLSLHYVGLFAPAKQKMRFDRVAAVLAELRELFSSGTVEWDGITYAAPAAYWMDAMESMLARKSEMELPLRNHNYLRKVVSGNLRREAAAAERKQEDQRAGRTQTGGLPPPPQPPPVAAPPKPTAKYTRPPIDQLRGAIGQLGAFAPKFSKESNDE